MRIGIACDHAGYELKEDLVNRLHTAGHEVQDFGAVRLMPQDDYPDYVLPMAQAVASSQLAKGIAVCGSGIGACIAANKVPGARAALCSDVFTVRRGVESYRTNVLCLGARDMPSAQAWNLVQAFVDARFARRRRHQRRLSKLAAVEAEQSEHDSPRTPARAHR